MELLDSSNRVVASVSILAFSTCRRFCGQNPCRKHANEASFIVDIDWSSAMYFADSKREKSFSLKRGKIVVEINV